MTELPGDLLGGGEWSIRFCGVSAFVAEAKNMEEFNQSLKQWTTTLQSQVSDAQKVPSESQEVRIHVLSW